MTGFDIIVLIIVALGAMAGFARGFIQEALSLGAWIFAAFAIKGLHAPLTTALEPYVGTGSGSTVLAFALLLLVPYAVIKLVAKWLGAQSRESVLGPIDRVLGFGFGGVKGSILVVLVFSILFLGYDTVWGARGRPDWITQSRTYPLVSKGSEALVNKLAERRRQLQEAESPEK